MLKILKVVYGDDIMSQPEAFERYKRLMEGQEYFLKKIRDLIMLARPSPKKMSKIIGRIYPIIKNAAGKYEFMEIQVCEAIIIIDLKMNWIAAIFVPKFTDDSDTNAL